MTTEWTTQAVRQLESLPPKIRRRIVDKMRFFADQPLPLQFAKRLTNPTYGSYRFRVGNYRVIVDVAQTTLFVVKVAKRDKVYE